MWTPNITKKITKREYQKTADYKMYGIIDGVSEVFIKEFLTDPGKEVFKKEYANQKFLSKLASKVNTGFSFLLVTRQQNKLCYPELIHAEWLGIIRKNKIVLTHSEYQVTFIKNFIKLQLEFFKIKFADLPKIIQSQARLANKEFIHEFFKNSSQLFAQKIITKKFSNEAEKFFKNFEQQKSYQYGKPLLWRTCVDHNKMYLVEAVEAGWHLKYFDLAECMLQTVAVSSSSDFSKQLWKIARREFKKNDQNFEEAFKGVFYYSGIRILSVFKDNQAVQKKLKNFIKEII